MNFTHAKAVGRKLGGDFSANQVLLARNTIGHMLARSRLVYAVATVIASIFLLIWTTSNSCPGARIPQTKLQNCAV